MNIYRRWLYVICVIVVTMYAFEVRSAERNVVDDNVIKDLKKDYEWSINYIRLLLMMTERLHSNRDLETMTKLHQKLLNKGSNFDGQLVVYHGMRNYSGIGNLMSIGLCEKSWNKEVMTGEEGILPWIEFRESDFDIDLRVKEALKPSENSVVTSEDRSSPE